MKELRSVRARRDGRLIHLTDLIRDAVNYYLAEGDFDLGPEPPGAPPTPDFNR